MDTEDWLLVVQVTAANQFDHRQLWSLLQAGRQRSTRLRHVWVDAGYQDGLTGFVGALPLRLGSRGRDAAAPRTLLAIIAPTLGGRADFCLVRSISALE